MKMKFDLTITKRIPKKLQGVIGDAINEVLEFDILAEAQERTPFKTGNNRRLISTELLHEGGRVGGAIFTTSGYGGHLEIGFGGRPARPYLRPAVANNAKKILEQARAMLAQGVG